MDVDTEEFVLLSESFARSEEINRHISSTATFRETLKHIWKIFWPVYLSLLFQYDMTLVSIAFSGQLNPDDLAATGLASSVINITAMGIGSGLSTGYDTLGAQAYGAKNFKKVGILLQKTLIILGLASCAIIAVWLNTESILKAWDEPPNVAVKTGIYLLIFIPGLVGMLIFRAVRSYIQVQGIVKPPVLTCFICTVLHILFNYIFIYPMHLGLVGLALASTCSMICMPVALFLYIYFTKIYQTTWHGFTTESLIEWSTFVRLAVLGMFSMLLKPLANEITVFLAGLVSTPALGAQAILFQMRMFAVLMPISVGIAVYILMGQALGAGRPIVAKAIMKYGLLLVSLIALATAIVMASCRLVVGRVFTNDSSVLKIVSETVPLVAFASFLESFQIVLTYITRAIGKPHISVLTMIVGYYIVGLSVGIVLTFVKNMGIAGMWIGIICAIILQCSLLLIILFFRIDFNEESKTARKRAGITTTEKKDYGSTINEKTEHLDMNEQTSKQPARSADNDGIMDNGNMVEEENNESAALLGEELKESQTVVIKFSDKNVTRRDIIHKCLVFLGGFVILLLGIIIRISF